MNVALGIATIAAMAGVQSQIAAVQPSNGAAADVSLRAFDVLGREVSHVVGERMDAGTHRRMWTAGALPSGVYYYRLLAGVFSATRRLILLR